MRAVLADNRLPHPMLSKVFGLVSDGTAFMTCEKGGVSALMKKENQMLVNVHCLAHRLAFCTGQAATDMRALKGYQQIITDINEYWSTCLRQLASAYW